MKVGDLVTKMSTWTSDETGLVIETGVYTGRRDTKILWSSGDVTTNRSKYLTLISPGAVPKTNLTKNNDNMAKQSNN